MAGAEVLQTLCLHEEEFQVIDAHVLLGREEVKPVIWPLGYVTTSRVAEVGVVRLMCTLAHSGPDQGGKQAYSCWSQDKIFGVWTRPDLIPTPDWLPQPHGFPASHLMFCFTALLLRAFPQITFLKPHPHHQLYQFPPPTDPGAWRPGTFTLSHSQ